MIRIPTRTLFQLLTVGIALMAVILMGMVGLMLYQAFATADPIVAEAPVMPTVSPPPWHSDSAMSSSNALHKILHPVIAEVKPKDDWGSAVANHGGYRLVGTASSAEGSSYVMLQNERTRDPMTLRVGQEKNGMQAVKVDLARSEAAVTINGQTKVLSRQEALVAAPRPGATGRPAVQPGQPGQPMQPSQPVQPGRSSSQGAQPAPAGSIRIISGGGATTDSTDNVQVDVQNSTTRGGRTEEQWRAEINERLRRDQRARTSR